MQAKVQQSAQPSAPKPKVFLGSDHGGFDLKNSAKKWLEQWGYEVEDLGAHSHDPVDDYPQYAFEVAEAVAAAPNQAVGLLFCRSGGGMAVAANKVPGAIAIEINSVTAAEHAKLHNNANIASLSADWLSEDQAKVIVKTFLVTAFSGDDRHTRRLAQIAQYEQH